MIFEERRRRSSPHFETHQKAHQEILANEALFGDGAPVIGKQFTMAKARERKIKVIDLLYRTARRERRAGNTFVADQLEIPADKLHYCQPSSVRFVGLPNVTAHSEGKVAAQETASTS
jgi:hypothetical protein